MSFEAKPAGFVREATSWLTNHSDLAETLERWRESVSGGESDKHVQEVERNPSKLVIDARVGALATMR